MNFKDEHNQLKLKIEDYLKTIFDNINAPKKIIEAMEYSLFSGGKRLRPVIMFYLAKTFNIDDEIILPLCASIEMIHTYSLIHDDLPSMDNDDLRRGKLSNHKKFGQDTAILAGDGLLNLAFETMLSNYPEKNADSYIKAANYIAACSGVSGMIGGQVIDIENNIKDIDEINKIHSLKTGKLFSAAVVSVAYLADLSDDITYKYQLFCEKLGLLFQITDDILDIIGDENKVGKTIGKDKKDSKSTYVSFFGLEGAGKKADSIEKECLYLLAGMNQHNGYLYSLIKYIRQREK